MSYPYDATLKDILGQGIADLTPLLNLPAHLPGRTLNIDLSTVSAATDVAFGFGQPLEQIVDLNFQSGPDPNLAARLLFYNAAYHHRYPVPVRSVLLLLRPSADHRELTGHLTYQAGTTRVEFQYEVMRLWQEPRDRFLTGGLALLPLAPLCQLPPDVPVAQAMHEVVQQIDQRLAAEVPYARAQKLMTATYVLAGLRVDDQDLDGLFRGVKTMIESSAFKVFENKGRVEEGQRMLLRVAQMRFGAPDPATESALQAIEDLNRLERIADAILTASSWQELLATP